MSKTLPFAHARGRGHFAAFPPRADSAPPTTGEYPRRRWPFPLRACADCARPPACAGSCARPACAPSSSCCRYSWPRRTPRLPPPTMSRCRPWRGCRSLAPPERAREAADLGLGAVILFGVPSRQGPRGHGRVRRRGRRAARRARAQAGAARRLARDHRRVPVRVHRPRPLRRAARGRLGRQRRHAGAARPHRRQPRRAPARTSSRPRT